MIGIVQHHVRDFETWQPAFEDNRPFREQYGCISHQLYRGLDDPNDVTIVMRYTSRERAEALLRDPRLKEVMDRAGVDSEPRITLLEEIEVAEYAVQRAA
jgi:quinol monooxygenase YgiN